MPTTPSGMYWDSHGPPDGPPVLLLEGYTGQLIGWREGFCAMLSAKGLRVLRMDNRDIGLSRHEPEGATYTIADMADDVRDVIDSAGLEKATVVGQSMGGLIAQHVALNHPDRVAGLVLFYTTPTIAEVNERVFQGDVVIPQTQAEAIEVFLSGNRDTASPAYDYDEEDQRLLASQMYHRNPDQSGVPRQRQAVRQMPDISDRLPEITVPVALIHGRDDALISHQGSVRIAEQIPQAELHLYPGLGHEIARPLWPDFVATIERTVKRAGEHHCFE
ncbi:alpha/beta hydrolase [Arthrobacter sp. NtRootA1]|uniref:alpha/beta fold hydrolase n=1 Tax=Arthrobacter sp. NtRootA1 TaxID=2830983 RepID=UPI001CC5547F|nr:alpha/beta hydrolase [Arthrobacter sp. NtRootA1]BCW05720.1 alpha/beta hydrolase [Arthrobacter sp. NtRootA1]